MARTISPKLYSDMAETTNCVYGALHRYPFLCKAGAQHALTAAFSSRRKIFTTEKFRESLPKRGGRNIRDKNIREGGSDKLHNTITWLLCLCGSVEL